MKITEALEKGKGKARKKYWLNNAHIVADGFGLITLQSNAGSGEFVLSLSDFKTDEWEPYPAEPERCEACKLKKAYEEQRDDFYSPAIIYLLNERCKCKKEAP